MAKPVIQYIYGIHVAPINQIIQIYENGYVKLRSKLLSEKKETEFYIPPNQVREYVSKLEQAGIFGSSYVYNGPDKRLDFEEFTINSNERTKYLRWVDSVPKIKGLSQIIKELKEFSSFDLV